jgi:hypothetical protein
MDRKYIDEHHLVARYLADQLPDAEREAFEAYYVEHPDVLAEMEAAARFKLGLLQLERAGELQRLLQPTPWSRGPRFLAAAAAIAMLAIGLAFFQMRGPTRQPLLVAASSSLVDRLGRPLHVASSHTLLRTRSTSYDAEIELPPSAQVIELKVLPESPARPARYRLVLGSIDDDDSMHEIATLTSLRPDEHGLVPVYLNAARLQRGRYRLVLSGDLDTSAANERSVFLLRVRSPGGAAL